MQHGCCFLSASNECRTSHCCGWSGWHPCSYGNATSSSARRRAAMTVTPNLLKTSTCRRHHKQISEGRWGILKWERRTLAGFVTAATDSIAPSCSDSRVLRSLWCSFSHHLLPLYHHYTVKGKSYIGHTSYYRHNCDNMGIKRSRSSKVHFLSFISL